MFVLACVSRICWFRLGWCSQTMLQPYCPPPPPPSLPFLVSTVFKVQLGTSVLLSRTDFLPPPSRGFVSLSYSFLLYLVSCRWDFFFFCCCCNQLEEKTINQRSEQSVSAPPVWSQPAAAAIMLLSSETGERLSRFRASRAALDLWM